MSTTATTNGHGPGHGPGHANTPSKRSGGAAGAARGAAGGWNSFRNRLSGARKPVNVAALPVTQSGPNAVHAGDGVSGYVAPPVTASAHGTSGGSPRLRTPALSGNIMSKTPEITLPDLPWLVGTWYVIHSSPGRWENARGVRTSWTRVRGEKLEEAVAYTVTGGSPGGIGKEASVQGVSRSISGYYAYKPKLRQVIRGYFSRKSGSRPSGPGRWEILGWSGSGAPGAGATTDQWIVTHWVGVGVPGANLGGGPGGTAGIDVLSRQREGLPPGLMGKIVSEISRVEAEAPGRTQRPSGAGLGAGLGGRGPGNAEGGVRRH